MSESNSQNGPRRGGTKMTWRIKETWRNKGHMEDKRDMDDKGHMKDRWSDNHHCLDDTPDHTNSPIFLRSCAVYGCFNDRSLDLTVMTYHLTASISSLVCPITVTLHDPYLVPRPISSLNLFGLLFNSVQARHQSLDFQVHGTQEVWKR
jgi:hypothetical protein